MWHDTVIWAILVASSAAILASAGAWDLRIRRVPDRHWALISAIGVACSSLLASGYAPAVSVLAYAASSALMAAYMLSERAPGMFVLPAAFIVSAWAYAETGYAGLLGPGIAFAAFLCMYAAGLIRGGADAKALMSLSLAFPAYPAVGGMPWIWPPSWPAEAFLCLPVSVLCLAAAFTAVPMALVGIVNASHGRFGRRMFTEYPVSTRNAMSSFVWTLQDVEGGRVVRTPPSDDPGAIRRLEDMGVTTVQATPMVPFVTFLAAGFAAAVALGNPLFQLFR